MKSLFYSIGNHYIEVEGTNVCATLEQMNNFNTFKCEVPQSNQPVYHFTESTNMDSIPFSTQIYRLFEEEIEILFGTTTTGYRLRLKWDNGLELNLYADSGSNICQLVGDMHPRLLTFTLWIGYGIMTVHTHTILVHSSCIVSNDKAILFLGESGTGKSTHTRLWRENIPGSHLLNDDSPIIRVEDGKVWAYGSPWSGKTPCYRSLRFELQGCVRLSQAPYNKMTRLSTLKAYACLHPSCPPAFAYDTHLYDSISETIGLILEKVNCYSMCCLPDAAAAKMSHHVLFNE